jgi:hypothetical protein
MDDFKIKLDMLCVDAEEPYLIAEKKLIRETILANIALKRDLTFEEVQMIFHNTIGTNIGMLLNSGFFELKMDSDASKKVAFKDQTVGLKKATPDDVAYLLDWVCKVSAERQNPNEVMYAIKQRELLNKIDLNLVGIRVLPCTGSGDSTGVQILDLHEPRRQVSNLSGKLIIDTLTDGWKDYVILPYTVVASANPKKELDTLHENMLKGKNESKRPKV